MLICLAPWAFGSVEAWAELGLYVGIAILTILSFPPSSGWKRNSGLGRLPGLALGGLVILALFQATPFHRGFLSRIAPNSYADRAQLLPDQPEHVLGDTQVAVALPALTLSLEPDSTLRMASRLAAAWLLFQAVSRLKGTPGVFLRLARFVIFNSALLALFAIVQGLTWNGCIYWVRAAHSSTESWKAGGPFLSHSHLAAYLNMGLGMALGLLLQGNWRDFLRRDSTKLWTAYAAAIIAVGVIASHSRSGFLGLLCASLLLACYLRRRLIPLGFGLAIVLMIIGLCLALLGGSSSFGSRLSTILDVNNEGYGNRIEIWRGALRAWWARPFWGSGFGVFPVAVAPYLRGKKIVFFARAENEYVDILVEGGAIGFVLVLAFLGGIGWLARRAIGDLPDGWRRGLVGGAVFGLIALSVQSSADFAPHIPAVGGLAVVLCGMIARQGQADVMSRETKPVDPSRSTSRDQPPPKRALQDSIVQRSPSKSSSDALIETRSAIGRLRTIMWASTVLIWLGSVVLSGFLVTHAVREAWIENRLNVAGLPIPGTYQTTVGTLETTAWGLDDYRLALEDVLRRRPNWSEGYLRLGLVNLGLYRQMTREWLADSGVAVDDINSMSEPLWLLGTVHEGPDRPTATLGKPDVLGFQPVLSHLVPAARCFLEARRCSPFLALPHAELAALDYLLARGDPTSTYANRALILSGNDSLLLTYLGQIAVQVGDRKLAARCWRRSLEVNHSSWTEIADIARLVLSPEEILSEITTDGCDAIRFADRLYREDKERPVRNRFFQVAIERFADSPEINTAERLFLEAHALANLEESVRAGKLMDTALAMEPAQAAWREEYIGWLLQWGRADEAHAQALKGQYFSPESKAIREAVDRTAEALARGSTPP